MSGISDQLAAVRSRIDEACKRSGRDISAIELIAVSKTFPADSVREAIMAGQTHFGESKLQEALPKIDVLPSYLHWHFIGRLQRNKMRKILGAFEVIHGIDSLKLAAYTNELAKELGIFPKCLLQVNLGGEETKGGFEPEELYSEMSQILGLDRVEIMGLMCVPPAAANPEDSRVWFSGLREMSHMLQLNHEVALPWLSMGMSGDYEIAVQEGATHVRVGSAIFGKRAYRVDGELG